MAATTTAELERLPVDQALELMRVPGRPRMFVLNAGVERRMSNHSQQVRAVNLIGGLLENKDLKAGDHVAIIGAGVAGTAAAVVALFLGLRVTLFEKRDDVLTQFLDSPRFIDPHLYDWPHERFKRTRSDLPFLTWTAGPASGVIAHIRAQWAQWARLYERELTVVRAVRRVDLATEPCGDREVLTWHVESGAALGSFAAVVLAVGFGPEQCRIPDRARGGHRDYWQERDLDRDGVLVVGLGDGAMSEIIARALTYDGKAMEEDVLGKFVRDVEVATPSADEVARRQTLTAALETLASSGTDVAVAARRRIEPDQLHEDAYELNAVIGRFLLKNRRIDGLEFQGSEHIHYRDPDFEVLVGSHDDKKAFTAHGPRAFPTVIERAGPQRPLESEYPEIWKLLKRAGMVERGQKLARGSGFAYAETKVPSADRARLFSDLFDSVTQRELYDGNGDGATEAYWRILEARAGRATVLVLPDSQVLDGRWFQSLAGSDQWQSFAKLVESGKLAIRIRAPSLAAQLDRYVDKKPFEFSSMEQGKELKAWMQRQLDARAPIKGWDELLRRIPDAFKRDFHAMATRIATLVTRLKALRRVEYEYDGGAFPLGTSFEDPGGFVHQLESGEGRDLAVEVFRVRLLRSDVFGLISAFVEKAKRLESEHADKSRRMRGDAEAIQSWYSRAYNRAIARQHDVDVFETTHVFDSLWWARACERSHDPTLLDTVTARAERLASGLRRGTSRLGPLTVPDTAAPGIEIPTDLCVLRIGADADRSKPQDFNAWNEAFSLVEYRRRPEGNLAPAFHLEFSGSSAPPGTG